MIFCVSDLHLGDRGCRDNFAVGDREKKLDKFLDYVGGNQVLILGDLIDCWTTNMSRAYHAYSKLFNRLWQMEAVWILGNHDNVLQPTDPWPWPNCPERAENFTAKINGKSFQFIHGHGVDTACNTPNPGIGNITAIISGLLEDRNGGPTRDGFIEDKFISVLEKALKLWRKEDRSKELLEKIKGYRTSEVLVFGHTHQAGQVGDTVYNCGCWCRDRDTFVQIDDRGSVSVNEWLGTKARKLEVQL